MHHFFQFLHSTNYTPPSTITKESISLSLYSLSIPFLLLFPNLYHFHFLPISHSLLIPSIFSFTPSSPLITSYVFFQFFCIFTSIFLIWCKKNCNLWVTPYGYTSEYICAESPQNPYPHTQVWVLTGMNIMYGQLYLKFLMHITSYECLKVFQALQ